MKEKLTASEWGTLIGQKILVEDRVEKLCGVVQRYRDIFLHMKNGSKYCLAMWCKPILKTLDQISTKDSQTFTEIFGIDPKDIGKTPRIEEIDWFRSQGYCLNPEWFAWGLAVKYDKNIHGDY